MLPASFYRRPLPEPMVPFSSDEGRGLFREALDKGTMEGYFPLAEQFHTQAEPSFCGLGTLVIVLNALGIDPGRLWRGPWRWYGEEMLDCCRPLDVVRREGVSLDDLACLARCNGASAEVRRPGEGSVTVDDFRRDLAHSCRSREGRHLVAGYHRTTLGQTGEGHYSPVGGYHAGRDLALVLDVARFKYPPHWVPVPALYEAMIPADPATGRPRGYVLLGRAAAAGRALGSVSCQERPFSEVTRRLRETLPGALRAAGPGSTGAAIGLILAHLPREAADLLDLCLDAVTDGSSALAPQHRALLAELIGGLRGLELFDLVQEALEGPALEGPAVRAWLSARSAPAERATLMLLVLPGDLLGALSPPLREHLEGLRATWALPPALRGEVDRLRTQIDELERRCA